MRRDPIPLPTRSSTILGINKYNPQTFLTSLFCPQLTPITSGKAVRQVRTSFMARDIFDTLPANLCGEVGSRRTASRSDRSSHCPPLLYFFWSNPAVFRRSHFPSRCSPKHGDEIWQLAQNENFRSSRWFKVPQKAFFSSSWSTRFNSSS